MKKKKKRKKEKKEKRKEKKKKKKTDKQTAKKKKGKERTKECRLRAPAIRTRQYGKSWLAPLTLEPQLLFWRDPRFPN